MFDSKWHTQVINKPSQWRCWLPSRNEMLLTNKREIRKKTSFSPPPRRKNEKPVLEAKKRWKIYGEKGKKSSIRKKISRLLPSRKVFTSFTTPKKQQPPQPSSFFEYFHKLRECIEAGGSENERQVFLYIFISMITTSITVNVVKSSSFTRNFETKFSFRKFFFPLVFVAWEKKSKESLNYVIFVISLMIRNELWHFYLFFLYLFLSLLKVRETLASASV